MRVLEWQMSVSQREREGLRFSDPTQQNERRFLDFSENPRGTFFLINKWILFCLYPSVTGRFDDNAPYLKAILFLGLLEMLNSGE